MEHYRTTLALLSFLCFLPSLTQAQETASDMLDRVYGASPERPEGYSFTHVIHYDIVQRVAGDEGKPLRKIEGTMDLLYTPGDGTYGRVMDSENVNLRFIGDLDLGMRYSLTAIGGSKIGSEASLNASLLDTLRMSRVSGDREIEGRMSAHYWYENGTTIDELWADSQASEEEVAIGRLWPRFEPGFASLAKGTYTGLAMRWVSIDTEFSREPRTVLEFRGAEHLETPVEISLEGYVFPVSEADMMRQRLEAERH